LDKVGWLDTWSTVNGHLLYSEPQTEDASALRLKGYEVFRSDPEDIYYTTDIWNFNDPWDAENNKSYNLLVSRMPVHIAASKRQVSKEVWREIQR